MRNPFSYVSDYLQKYRTVEPTGLIEGEQHTFISGDFEIRLTEPSRESTEAPYRNWNVDIYRGRTREWQGSYAWDSHDRKVLVGESGRVAPKHDISADVERLCSASRMTSDTEKT